MSSRVSGDTKPLEAVEERSGCDVGDDTLAVAATFPLIISQFVVAAPDKFRQKTLRRFS
jgi:hypothetical protein